MDGRYDEHRMFCHSMRLEGAAVDQTITSLTRIDAIHFCRLLVLGHHFLQIFFILVTMMKVMVKLAVKDIVID